MNTTKFTTDQLRKSIPVLIGMNKGLTNNECGHDTNLIEFDEKEPIEITFAEEDKGFVYVKFKQHYTGDDSFDNMDAWTWEYSTVQLIEDVKMALSGL